MAEFPSLPLWTDAYIADTQHLTNEEHGVYLRLLMFAWRTPTCSLPDDDQRLAIMVGATPKVWARLKPVVMAFWDLSDGQWTQKKLTRERDYVRAKREQCSAAGKASAEAKALKNNNGASTDVVTGGQREGQREANTHTHTHTQKKEKDNSGSGEPPSDYAFEGNVVRLTHKDFKQWEQAFSHLELRAELVARDAYLAELGPKDRKNWFMSTSQHFKNLNAKAKSGRHVAPGECVDVVTGKPIPWVN